jgi:HdeA/HdeB family
MKKNSLIILSFIGASALAVFSLTATVQAKDAGEWTCEDFLKVSKSAQSSVVYYLIGLNRAQAKEFHDISAEDFKVPVSKVVQHCRTNPPANLWDAIVNHFYWRAMKMN